MVAEKIFFRNVKKSIDTGRTICYNTIRKRKEKEIKKMKKVNLWKSIYSEQVYEMPLDWMPKFGGWELVGTITKAD